MEYIVFTLVFIVIILICLIIDQKRNYELEITKKNKEISSITSESNFYKNEYEKRKDIVEINYEVTSADEFMPLNKLEYKPIYKGKKALIGDYLVYSYTICWKSFLFQRIPANSPEISRKKTHTRKPIKKTAALGFLTPARRNFSILFGSSPHAGVPGRKKFLC